MIELIFASSSSSCRGDYVSKIFHCVTCTVFCLYYISESESFHVCFLCPLHHFMHFVMFMFWGCCYNYVICNNMHIWNVTKGLAVFLLEYFAGRLNSQRKSEEVVLAPWCIKDAQFRRWPLKLNLLVSVFFIQDGEYGCSSEFAVPIFRSNAGIWQLHSGYKHTLSVPFFFFVVTRLFIHSVASLTGLITSLLTRSCSVCFIESRVKRGMFLQPRITGGTDETMCTWCTLGNAPTSYFPISSLLVDGGFDDRGGVVLRASTLFTSSKFVHALPPRITLSGCLVTWNSTMAVCLAVLHRRTATLHEGRWLHQKRLTQSLWGAVEWDLAAA